jgi:hypothetical protein
VTRNSPAANTNASPAMTRHSVIGYIPGPQSGRGVAPVSFVQRQRSFLYVLASNVSIVSPRGEPSYRDLT